MTEGRGICPVCNGSKRTVCEYDPSTQWLRSVASYDPETHTVECRNCGGQYQWGSPTGEVRLRKDNGEPCKHEYRGYSKGRCYTGYTCVHCDDNYSIDSGD